MGKIGAFKKANRQDLTGDLNYTQSQLDALSKNLLTTGKGLARSLTADQQRQLDAIKRIAAKAEAKVSGVVQGAASAVAERYGSAMGPAVQADLIGARGIVKATGTIGAGAVKEGAGLASAGQVALAIQQSASKEAYEGANYAMAVALKSRAQTDASQAAQMQFQLDQARLQADLDLRNQKAMAKFSLKMEEKKLGSVKGATETAGGLASLMPALRAAMSSGEDMNAWMAANVPPSLLPYFQELLPRMTSRGIFDGNFGYQATVDAIVDSLVAANPELLKMRSELESVVLAHLKTAWNSATMGTLNTGADTAVPNAVTGDLSQGLAPLSAQFR